jgi:hypothetical protein
MKTQTGKKTFYRPVKKMRDDSESDDLLFNLKKEDSLSLDRLESLELK